MGGEQQTTSRHRPMGGEDPRRLYRRYQARGGRGHCSTMYRTCRRICLPASCSRRREVAHELRVGARLMPGKPAATAGPAMPRRYTRASTAPEARSKPANHSAAMCGRSRNPARWRSPPITRACAYRQYGRQELRLLHSSAVDALAYQTLLVYPMGSLPMCARPANWVACSPVQPRLD